MMELCANGSRISRMRLSMQMDLLDEYQTGMVCRFFPSPNSVTFLYKMAGKIKDILKRFDEVAEGKIPPVRENYYYCSKP